MYPIWKTSEKPTSKCIEGGIDHDEENQNDYAHDDGFIVYDKEEVKQAKKKMEKRLSKYKPKNKPAEKTIPDEDNLESSKVKENATSPSQNNKDKLENSKTKMRTRSKKKNRLVNNNGRNVESLNLMYAFDEEIDDSSQSRSLRKKTLDDEDYCPSYGNEESKYISKSRQMQYKNIKEQKLKWKENFILEESPVLTASNSEVKNALDKDQELSTWREPESKLDDIEINPNELLEWLSQN